MGTLVLDSCSRLGAPEVWVTLTVQERGREETSGVRGFAAEQTSLNSLQCLKQPFFCPRLWVSSLG